jgi:hypothetical protein
MAASLTLIIVGIMLLTTAWDGGYAIVCIMFGVICWHFSDNARRSRMAVSPAPPRLARARQALAATAATLEVIAVLMIGGAAFDHPGTGLFDDLSPVALLEAAGGAALLFTAAQLNQFKLRLNEAMLSSLLGAR